MARICLAKVRSFLQAFYRLAFFINGNKICYHIVADINYWCDKCFMWLSCLEYLICLDFGIHFRELKKQRIAYE